MYAKSNRSKISPVDDVAFSQKLSCKPQTSTARTGGSQAPGMVRKENSLVSRCRCSWVRSWGSKETERASRAKVKAAQTAVNKFNANGRMLAGTKWKG